jgi:hypothetical protein
VRLQSHDNNKQQLKDDGTGVGGERGDLPLRALIYDSLYESYKGVICSFRIIEGSVKKGDVILFMGSKKSYEVSEVSALLTPHMNNMHPFFKNLMINALINIYNIILSFCLVLFLFLFLCVMENTPL